jgi:hypothetical protein
MSLITLKKHSTSSLVLDRGCSGPRESLKQRLHSLVSISAARADNTSLVNPQIEETLLYYGKTYTYLAI